MHNKRRNHLLWLSSFILFLLLIFGQYEVSECEDDGFETTTVSNNLINEITEETLEKVNKTYQMLKNITKEVPPLNRDNATKNMKNYKPDENIHSPLNKVVDCLGLGSIIASQIESFFKQNDNGSNAQDIRFFLTSRKLPRKVEVIIGKQFGLEWTDFEVRRNTVVIVHGFLSNGSEEWVTNMTTAFLKLNDFNVVAVDWSASNTFNYYKAVVNTRTTGSQIAIFFDQIANDTLANNGPKKKLWGSIHCVGHSLGAHICAYAANEIKRRRSGFNVRRITGLDPAQPCFKTNDLSLRLDKSDAPFVDVIHTNGRILTNLGLGLPQPIGHVDFYPNGGKLQPGCVLNNLKLIAGIMEIPKKAICSHGRSYVYFTATIYSAITKQCRFWAHPWDRTYRNIKQILAMNCHSQMCTEMGINSEKYPFLGSFFVLTSSNDPYCHPGRWDWEEVKQILKEDYKDSLDD